MKTLILKILPVCLMVLFAVNVQAQINTTAGTVTSCPGEIVVPVNVTNCNGVGAISLVLNYDDTKLTYLGYQNVHTSLSGGLLIVNQTGNKVVFSWARTTAASPGNTTLVEYRFSAVASTTSLTWDLLTPGNCEYSDINGNILAATFTNGTATINTAPYVNTQPVNRSVLVGENTTFSFTGGGAGVVYQWQLSTNGGGSWTDLVNNSTYGNVNGTTLYITNCLLAYNGYKYRCRLTGTCSPITYTDVVTLTVINPVISTLPVNNHCPGSITVPVTVSNFTNIASFSLMFSFNTAVLTYTGYQNVNAAVAGSNFVINVVDGMVMMTWASTTPATFPTGTLVEINFTGVPGVSPLLWDDANEGHCEYVNLNGEAYTAVYTDGSETVHTPPSIISSPANVTIAKGQNTSFSVSASGTGLTYRWQVSTDGGGIYTDLSNNSTYSNVTSTTMYITNAQLAMSGYKYRCKVTGTCLPVVYSDPGTLTVLPNILTYCGTSTVCPGQVIIPVTVTDFIGVASLSLKLNFNSSLLTYTGHQNLNPAITGSFVSNSNNGSVYLTWAGTTTATIATGGKLVDLVFTGVPGTGNLTWDTQTPGACEYSDINGLIIFSTWNNGSFTVQTPPYLNTHPVNKTIYGGGSTTFSVTAGGTGLVYGWQVSTNGGGSWANLSSTSPYSGVFGPTLTINPAAVSMNGYLYHCVVSGTCTPSVTSDPAQLTVTPNAINTTPGSLTNSCTGNLVVPISVTNCNNVGSISLTMIFDTTKLSYAGYEGPHAGLSGGLLVVNRQGNKVYMSWASTTALNIGASGTLINYRFKSNASTSTTLSWDTQTPGACEYTDINGAVITSFYSNSSISTIANALVVNAGPDKTKTTAPVQLDGSFSGGIAPFTYLWTPSTGLSNPAILTPTASPTITTEYKLTINSSGCSGADYVTVTVIAVPENLLVQNETVGNGVSNCYNATNTITVAGSGTTFLVQNGGSAVMIAGMKILYLPGTTVQSGGYMHGYITNTGQYCNSTSPSMPLAASDEETVGDREGLFRVFPNPSNGRVTIERMHKTGPEHTSVLIYNMFGSLVQTIDMTGVDRVTPDLSSQPAGIYLVKMNSTSGQTVKKLVIR